MGNSFCKSVCCFFFWKSELAGLSLFFTVTPSRLSPGKIYSTPLYLFSSVATSFLAAPCLRVPIAMADSNPKRVY
jgi:hypothetical protein